MANQPPGQTLQPTALVHEAWLRLVGGGQRHWNSRGHFFAAAAEAMRRILIEAIRRKQSQQRGGDWQRIELDESSLVLERPAAEMLDIDAALEKLAREDALAADLVKLRYFVGLTISGSRRGAEHLGPNRRPPLGLCPQLAQRGAGARRVRLGVTMQNATEANEENEGVFRTNGASSISTSRFPFSDDVRS